MNLYLISQDEQEGYDTFDSAVVAAENEEEARNIHPETHYGIHTNEYYWEIYSNSWASDPKKVTVTLIGTAIEGTLPGVICTSYNAG